MSLTFSSCCQKVPISQYQKHAEMSLQHLGFVGGLAKSVQNNPRGDGRKDQTSPNQQIHGENNDFSPKSSTKTNQQPSNPNQQLSTFTTCNRRKQPNVLISSRIEISKVYTSRKTPTIQGGPRHDHYQWGELLP